MDNLNKKNKILININEDNSCNISFKLTNVFGEEFMSEIKLYKEYMNNKDNKEIEYLKNKINELNKNINKNEKDVQEVKEILCQKILLLII